MRRIFLALSIFGCCFNLNALQTDNINQAQKPDGSRGDYSTVPSQGQVNQENVQHCPCGCTCRAPCRCGCMSGKPCNCPR